MKDIADRDPSDLAALATMLAKPSRMPDVLQDMLVQIATPQRAPDLHPTSQQDILRLKSLCVGMVERLLDETDDTRFGDINPLIDDAAHLAYELGFHAPPAGRVLFDRALDPDRKDQASESLLKTKDGFQFGEGIRVRTPGRLYEYKNAHGITRVTGYRFYDPAPITPSVEIHNCILIKTDTPGRRCFDLLANASKSEARDVAVQYLRRWVRFIDAATAGPAPADPDAVRADLPRAGEASAKKKGITWQHAKEIAEAHCSRNPFPGVNALAKIVGCSQSTMSVAIDHSAPLRALLVEHKAQRKSSNGVAMSGAVIGKAAQTRELDPADAASRSTDNAFRRLLEDATPRERAKLLAMSATF